MRGQGKLGLLIAGVLASALAGAACGGGGDSTDVKLENVNPSIGTPTPEAERPVQEIKVTDQGCDPANVTVKARTRVVWKWQGTTNPVAIMLAGQKSPEQTTGEYQRDFDQPGLSYTYQCGATTGKIVVE
ncbi:hypothetical protein [Tepidiforma sp.]|uniref:cupredoxin domain-containing protein n=1 Tax=Tepidiforma sp. TaxID=2682230 RepID=UPI002ADE210A|nr:hypothetical protein [Tepidiforma sp.]